MSGTTTNKGGKHGKKKRPGSEAKLLITTLAVSAVLTGWAGLARTTAAQPRAAVGQAVARAWGAPNVPAGAGAAAIPTALVPPTAGAPYAPPTTRRAQSRLPVSFPARPTATVAPTATPVPAPVVITQSSR